MNIWGVVLIFIIVIGIRLFLKPRKKYKLKYKKYSKKEKRNKITNQTLGYNSFYKKNNNKTSYKEKIEKGEEYEKFISQYFKEREWISYEHGLEKGLKDGGIDLIVKKDKEFLFIQCKNWDSNHKYKMGIKKIKEYRKKTKEFMLKNPRTSRMIVDLNYKIKLVFISTEDIYTQEAKKYIKENKDILEYKIIPIK